MSPRATALALTLVVLAWGLVGCARQPPLRLFTAAAPDAETVLLVHGLARSGRSMLPLAHHLRARGYHVVVLDYPSTTAPVATLAREHLAPAFALARTQGRPVHLVTHSLGGILVRELARSDELPGLGRAVMLAPPNRGSEVVDRIGDWWLFGRVNGPAGRELGTDPAALPLRLPPIDFDGGVIAGHRSINWINSGMIPGPDDGKVAVARTAVAGMHDSAVLPTAHPFIMTDRRVWHQIDRFLATGTFDHEAAPTIEAWLAQHDARSKPTP